eukprot:scaffold54222_cov65-Cyclotella_meneghiniana.AAC.1
MGDNSDIAAAHSLLSLSDTNNNNAITLNPSSFSVSQEVTPSPVTLRRSLRVKHTSVKYKENLDVTQIDLPNKRDKSNPKPKPNLKPREKTYDQTVEPSTDGGEKSTILRGGKWTPEESAYANRLIVEFKEGTLPLPPNNITLRKFLSGTLGCDPLRITKKFKGGNGGRVFYQPSNTVYDSSYTMTATRGEVKALEDAFFFNRIAKTKSSSLHAVADRALLDAFHSSRAGDLIELFCQECNREVLQRQQQKTTGQVKASDQSVDEEEQNIEKSNRKETHVGGHLIPLGVRVIRRRNKEDEVICTVRSTIGFYKSSEIHLKSPGSFIEGNYDTVGYLFEEASRTVQQANQVKQSQVWENREALFEALKAAGLTAPHNYLKRKETHIGGHLIPVGVSVDHRKPNKANQVICRVTAQITFQRKNIQLKSPGSFIEGNYDTVPDLFEEASRTVQQANQVKQSQVWENQEALFEALKDAGLTYSKRICVLNSARDKSLGNQ